MELDGGTRSRQFPGQPLSRVNCCTNQMLPPVMASALMICASFTHLAFLRLPDFSPAELLRLSTALQVCSPGAHFEKCNFSAPLLTGLLLSEITEERRGKCQSVSHLFSLLVSHRVNNCNVHKGIILSLFISGIAVPSIVDKEV